MSAALILAMTLTALGHGAQSSLCQLTFSSDNLDTGTFNVTQLLTADGGQECLVSFKNTKRDGYTQLWLQFKLNQPATTRTHCNSSVLAAFGADYSGQLENQRGYLLGRYCNSANDLIQTSYRYVVILIKRLQSNENMFVSGKCTFSSTTPGKQLPNVNHSQACGQRVHSAPSGTLSSPAASAAAGSPTECSWTVMVPPKQLVMLVITELSLGSRESSCFKDGEHLSIYNGLADASRSPDLRLCGQMDFLEEDGRVIVSTNSWLNIRYVSRGRRGSSFKASWTAIIMPGAGHSCGNGSQLVTCEAITPCSKRSEGLCWPGSDDHFCIDSSLRCDGKRDCGFYSNADEDGCTSTTVILLAILLPTTLLAFVGFVLIVRYAYKRTLHHCTTANSGVGCPDCNESAAARRHFRRRVARGMRQPWLRLEGARKSESAAPLSGLAAAGSCSGGEAWSPGADVSTAALRGSQHSYSIWTSELDLS